MSEKDEETKSSDKVDKQSLDDEVLEKLAVEELMREAVQGAARAELVGPSGWVKVPQQKTNKRFLVNTIRSAVASNKYHSSKNYRNSSNNHRHSESSIKKDTSRRKR